MATSMQRSASTVSIELYSPKVRFVSFALYFANEPLVAMCYILAFKNPHTDSYAAG